MAKLKERLNKREVKEVMKNGTKVRERNLTFVYERKDKLKVAFVPVGVKKSVKRNRVRRKIREIFFKLQEKFKNMWVVIIIPPLVEKRKEEVIIEDFEDFLRKVEDEKGSALFN
ncbi:MAG: ribonuclease P protein component [Caldiserica bacterium]|nr:MAG: ribonuclease P protein component [Caldisericota bacterium]